MFKMINSPDDHHTLQHDAYCLTSWSNQWLLRFHPDKWQLMHLGKTVHHAYVYNMNVDNNAHRIGQIEDEKYKD